MSKISSKDAKTRQIDDSLLIAELITSKEFSFDLVEGRLVGKHPALKNRVSDRAYYVLDGEGSIRVGDEVYGVVAGDIVQVPRGMVHALSGDLRYLIITSPPFSPENEEIVTNELSD